MSADRTRPPLCDCDDTESRLLTQNHEDQIDVQEVREADGGADGFWQRDTEESGLVKDGDGLDHSDGCGGVRTHQHLNPLIKIK